MSEGERYLFNWSRARKRNNITGLHSNCVGNFKTPAVSVVDGVCRLAYNRQARRLPEIAILEEFQE